MRQGSVLSSSHWIIWASPKLPPATASIISTTSSWLAVISKSFIPRKVYMATKAILLFPSEYPWDVAKPKQ